VLCLDDFELLVKHRKAFDDDFYNNMRYLMGDHRLMLIIASRQQIKVYKEEYNLASSFFNDVHSLLLEGLCKEEVTELLMIKESTGEVALSVEEQGLARSWGKDHPRLLQLAGSCLFYARQSGKGIDWAKKKFNEQAKNAPKPTNKWVKWLARKVQALPMIGGYLARIVLFTGNLLTIGGALILLFGIVLFSLGYVSWDSLQEILPSLPEIKW